MRNDSGLRDDRINFQFLFMMTKAILSEIISVFMFVQSVRNILNIKNFQMSQATNQKQGQKCRSCETFFACAAFNGFCSKCYKDIANGIKEKESNDCKTSVSMEDRELVEEFAGLSLKPQEKPEQKDKKRCFNCNKKTGLLGVECKCGYVYCNTHRLPENHQCLFNHKALLEERLKTKLNKVTHGKITEI